MKREELKVALWDLETYKELLIVGGYNPWQDKWIKFEVSRRMNQLDAMVKYLKEEPVDYYCYFNGVKFDSQVLQYILDNYEHWYDKSWKEVTTLIYEFVQQLIDDQDYEIAPKYREQYIEFKQIDLFLILHMDNQARRSSLKWCAYSMDEDIEELPIAPGKEDLSEQEIADIVSYWENDIKVLHRLWNYCTGETDHETYKGKDKIQLRLDLIEEMQLPHTAINWNDVKIGAELNKKAYLDLTGISNQKLWDKIKNRKTRTKFKFGDCFPSYWKFDSKEFQEFFKKIAGTTVNLNIKQEFPFSYKGTDYMFAKGGGHSGEKGRYIKPTENQILMDCDIASMYPNAIRKRNLYPNHLGPKWNQAYISNIQKRIEAKKLYKETKEKKYDNFQETYKLVLNGNFGRLIDRHDWQYDPFTGMQVTIGSQVDIFMLVEDLEIAGIHVISLNTDGIVVLMNRDQLSTYLQVCKAWEKQIGNDTMGNLEYQEYSLLVQLSVNDYIAVKKGDWKEENGELKFTSADSEPDERRIKKKGDFLTSYDLHKNKSRRIIPMALEKYFVYNIPVEDTINQCTDIYAFSIAKKASKDYYYKSVDRTTGKETLYKRLIRYYCSKDIGEKLIKCKHEFSDKSGPAMSQCESTSKRQIVFNKRIDNISMEELSVDREWYIDQCYKMIGQVLPEIARDRKEKAAGVLSLF